MKLPIWQVDAFTSRLFAGNPAAVVLLDEWLPDETLKSIAAENNLAETAFVIASGDVMPLRWFTPTVEVDLCGHATLASAHVLFKYRFASADRLTFSTRSGNLAVTREGDLLSLDFPARPGTPTAVSSELIETLGSRPSEALRGRDVLAVLDSETQVREFEPDIQRIAAFDTHALMVTARGDDVDYVYRFFAPKQGIPEDAVTGSANCMLVPYWAERLGKKVLEARQLSARGGELRCTLVGDRVLIAGRAVEYLRGEIEVIPSP